MSWVGRTWINFDNVCTVEDLKADHEAGLKERVMVTFNVGFGDAPRALWFVDEERQEILRLLKKRDAR